MAGYAVYPRGNRGYGDNGSERGENTGYREDTGEYGRYRADMGDNGGYRADMGDNGGYRAEMGDNGGYRADMGDNGVYRSDMGDNGGYRADMGDNGVYRADMGDNGGYRADMGNNGEYRSENGEYRVDSGEYRVNSGGYRDDVTNNAGYGDNNWQKEESRQLHRNEMPSYVPPTSDSQLYQSEHSNSLPPPPATQQPTPHGVRFAPAPGDDELYCAPANSSTYYSAQGPQRNNTNNNKPS